MIKMFKLVEKTKSIWPYLLVVCICTSLFVLGLYQLEVLMILNYEKTITEFVFLGVKFPWWFIRDIAYTYAVISFVISFVSSIFIRRERDCIVKTLLLTQVIIVTFIGLVMYSQLIDKIIENWIVKDPWFELPFGYAIPTDVAYVLFNVFILISVHSLPWFVYVYSILKQ